MPPKGNPFCSPARHGRLSGGMSEPTLRAMLVHLADRVVLAVTGEDRLAHLQGLVSADMRQAAPGRCLWSALLTPQGKYLADFFVHATPDALLLDVLATQATLLRERLLRFRLRARVAIEAAPLAVHVGWPERPEGAVPDPRLPEAGFRLLAPPLPGTAPLPGADERAAWERHRIPLGLPEPCDLEPEKTVLLEAGFDELGGIAWDKGCWMGQELTARTRYRGLVRRRLLPVAVAGGLPPPGTVVWDAQGREVGVLRSGIDAMALATLRLDALSGNLRAGTATLSPRIPTWVCLPEPA